MIDGEWMELGGWEELGVRLIEGSCLIMNFPREDISGSNSKLVYLSKDGFWEFSSSPSSGSGT